jgi:putative Mn2+ efflux pump MntP
VLGLFDIGSKWERTSIRTKNSMDSPINKIFIKIIAANLIVVGFFAVVIPIIAIYKRKYDDQNQINRLYAYLAGGILLIVIGAIIYR